MGQGSRPVTRSAVTRTITAAVEPIGVLTRWATVNGEAVAAAQEAR